MGFMYLRFKLFKYIHIPTYSCMCGAALQHCLANEDWNLPSSYHNKYELMIQESTIKTTYILFKLTLIHGNK